MSGLTLFDKFIARLVFARRRRRGRTTAKRGRQTRPERTAHGAGLRLTVCLDQGVKLALVLPDVLLLLPVEGLRLATLGFEVCQGQRGRVLGVRRVSGGGQVGGGKGGPRADLLFVSGEERADGKVTTAQTLINELVACIMEVEDAFGCTLPPPRAFHSSIN